MSSYRHGCDFTTDVAGLVELAVLTRLGAVGGVVADDGDVGAGGGGQTHGAPGPGVDDGD